MEISSIRKKEIAELAEFISNEYCPKGVVLPEVIAEKSGITYNYGEYGDFFDGMLEHDAGKFHIYLNKKAINYNDNTRLRFSFAHELGHYFIDEHRNALKKGKSLHKSYNKLLSKNIVEYEADCFASNLLMPSKRFSQFIQKRKFDFLVIESLSKEFDTSLSATLFKFVEIGNHPIMVVYSKNNKIKYHWNSLDFPYKYIQNYTTKEVPPLTVAGDYFNNDIECEDAEIVNANEWFSSHDNIRDVQLFEKCIYQKKWGTVISIIWEK